jgi:pantoate--beta-alanine ligase
VIPVIARTRAGLAAARACLPGPVVLVPTMGALHDGHRALLRRARELSQPGGSVVVSIFVNPLQFGPAEDLDRYPRTLEQDVAVCCQEGAAVVFAPGQSQLYPAEQTITVNPGAMGRVLEGKSRPHFFDGVLTVVLKLLHLVRPDVAVFGQKDAQQLTLIRRMTAEMNLEVEIAVAPIFRDPDGLAAASRNSYLSARERATALALPRALQAAEAVAASAAGPAAVLAAARARLAAAAAADPPLVLDYLALADPATFEAVGESFRGPALLLAACTVGATRLIDNAELLLRGSRRRPSASDSTLPRPDGQTGAPCC